MPIVIGLLLIALGWPEAQAEYRTRPCAHRLIDLQPEFDLDLQLNAEQLSVTYKGQTFPVTPLKYLLLQLILEAPKEVIPYDDLIKELWQENLPVNPLNTIEVFLGQLRTKFSAVDPEFEKLKCKWKEGFYWARDDHEKTVLGRVGLAKFISEGYADDQAIALTPAEYAILSYQLPRYLISAKSVKAVSHSTFKTVVCSLNKKFKGAIGHNVLVPGPRGLGSFKLNQLLRVPRS